MYAHNGPCAFRSINIDTLLTPAMVRARTGMVKPLIQDFDDTGKYTNEGTKILTLCKKPPPGLQIGQAERAVGRNQQNK